MLWEGDQKNGVEGPGQKAGIAPSITNQTGHARGKSHDHAVHNSKGDILGTIDHKEAGLHKPGASFVLDQKTGKPIAHYDQHKGRGLDEWKGRILALIEARIKAFESAPNEPSTAQQRPSEKGGIVSLQERQGLSIKKGEEFQEARAVLQKGLLSPSEAASSSKMPPVVEKAFVAFLKVFYSWFAKGEGETKKQDASLPPDQARYAKKEEKAWADLLKKTVPFTLSRKTDWKGIEAAVFRGVVRNPPEVASRNAAQTATREGAQKEVVVSDLIFANGKMEKFARIPIAALANPAVAARVLAHLESMLPGEKISKALLMEWFGAGGELSFLALSHKVVRPELAKAFKSALTESAEGRSEEAAMAYGREASQGIALSARTEEMVARQLDINLRPTNVSGVGEGDNQNSSGVAGGTGPAELSHKTLFGLRKGRRRGGASDEGEILIPGFVPWYELVFKPYNWKGKKVRWWVPLLYLVAASTVGLGSVYVFKFLLQR
ncbi:MAG: hypothetical protein HY542_01205 [Deltaproteobacteria bacterium]|nr:hypothetical protein [Deltaproteobacteria bacterium]